MAINCNRNFDYTNPTLFKFTIDKFPNLEFFSKSVTLPGISAGEITQPSPIFDLKIAGDKLIFDPLTVSFIVTEDLSNYREIVNWMYGLFYPFTTDQYKELVRKNPILSDKENKYTTGHLFVLTNKLNPIVEIVFYNLFPTNISPLTYDASVPDATPLTADVTFAYSYYEIKNV